ncbi:MAG: hypothetical protein EHM28_05115 [Spirochaetaceae bacterium]|nr:MAG: hypothetical protein EHM28_05115 [Spirochaetaceae bacterium]
MKAFRLFVSIVMMISVLSCVNTPSAGGNAAERNPGQSAERQTGRNSRDNAAVSSWETPAGNTPSSVIQDVYVVLGRPTTTSIAARVIIPAGSPAVIEYGSTSGSYTQKTVEIKSSRETPATFVLSGLKSDSRYYYRVRYTAAGVAKTTPEHSFITARTGSSPYTFVIQSDSHLLNKADKPLYAQDMADMAALKPDFFFDLGDTFLADKDPATPYSVINSIYYEQLPYLSAVAQSSPLFLVIGNHEGEYGYLLNNTKDNMSVYSALSRKQFYPNPVPDSFYSGNTASEPFIGQPENYYAFTWGDTLYVALDPYRYTLKDPAQTRDSWDWTIGDAQYKWFKATLESSTAKYKFVFAHHAIGNIRGGAKVAGLFEWGGQDQRGKNLLAEKRPGWTKSIQQIMNDTHVTIFFQGHDHIFSREKAGDVVYQTLPKPAEKIPDQESNVSYYEGGDNQINTGFLQVSVSPQNVRVDYHRPYVAGMPDNKDIGIVYSYTVDSAGKVTVLKKTDDTAAFAAYGGGPKDTEGDSGRTGRQNQDRGNRGSADSRDNSPSGIVNIGMSGALDGLTLIGSPTDSGITLSTAFDKAVRYYYEYGTASGSLGSRTQENKATAGSTATEVLSGLKPATTYYYRLMTAAEGAQSFTASTTNHFVTRKPAGTPFTFTIEADPHLDENSSQQVYESELNLMAKDNPDFMIDLGDSSMAEKLATDTASYTERNKLLRSYWDNIGGSVPFFMVIGNHDGEHGGRISGTRPSGDQAAAIRRTWFPNPSPAAGSMYSGLRDTIYAFEWSDALFIVLDPYINTNKSATDNWSWTLGKAQYDWLASVLKNSQAKYRFVFIHNLVGGMGKDARGGADYAGMFEWGGKNPDGTDGFAAKRPGWEMPIHALFVKYKVDIVFHGHDHLYAKEEKDGIIYQCVPQPSLARSQTMSAASAAEYGYTHGTFLPAPGYLRLSVTPQQTKVELVQGTEGKIADIYTIKP